MPPESRSSGVHRSRLHQHCAEDVGDPQRANAIDSVMIGVALSVEVGVDMGDKWHREHLGDDATEQAAGDETLLGAAGDEVPPGGGVAGSFSQEFPGADPYAGISADEVGLPPLSEAEQEAVAREADRIADERDARRNL